LIKAKFRGKHIRVFFQRGDASRTLKTVGRIANFLGVAVFDVSGKSLALFRDLYECDILIGTRLHSHILFLSINKPSFLLSVDMRTEAFLGTIETPSSPFTFSGITKLVNEAKKSAQEGDFGRFDHVPGQVSALRAAMKDFIVRIDSFIKVRYYHEKDTA